MRKNPLPKREADICSRIRDFRKATRLSRTTFASEWGVDSAELMRIEYLRAPVRFSTGDAIARRFSLNQHWLATGEPPKDGYHRHSLRQIQERALFSQVVDDLLTKKIKSRQRFSDAVRDAALKVHFLEPIGVPQADEWKSQLYDVLSWDLIKLPPDLYGP